MGKRSSEKEYRNGQKVCINFLQTWKNHFPESLTEDVQFLSPLLCSKRMRTF